MITTRSSLTAGRPDWSCGVCPIKGGDPQFVAPVPEGCVAFTVSITARRAVCDFNTRQSDLVLVTGLAASGR